MDGWLSLRRVWISDMTSLIVMISFARSSSVLPWSGCADRIGAGLRSVVIVREELIKEPLFGAKFGSMEGSAGDSTHVLQHRDVDDLHRERLQGLLVPHALDHRETARAEGVKHVVVLERVPGLRAIPRLPTEASARMETPPLLTPPRRCSLPGAWPATWGGRCRPHGCSCTRPSRLPV